MKKTSAEIFTYGIASVGMYALVFLFLGFFVEVTKLSPGLSFLITYTLLYPLTFLVQLKIFKSRFERKQMIRFGLHIAIFYVLSNVIYNLILMLEWHYMLVACVTVGIIFPLRFLSSKLFVFAGYKRATASFSPEQ